MGQHCHGLHDTAAGAARGCQVARHNSPASYSHPGVRLVDAGQEALLEALKFIAANKELLLALLFLIVLFRDQISKLLPEIIRAKFGIKKIEAEPALPSTELKDLHLEDAGAVGSRAYHFPEMAMVTDAANFRRWVLIRVDEQRQKCERVTFNFISIRSTNSRFISGWKEAVLRILQDNSVCVMFVFAGPDRIIAQMRDLKEYVEEESVAANKTTICVRVDDRRMPAQ
jgi:hypothetical protein